MQIKNLKYILFSIFIVALCLKSTAQKTKYSLQDCIAIAMEKNLTIQRSRLDLELNKIEKKQAQLERLPDLNMNSNYSVNLGRSIDPTTNQFITLQNNSSYISGSSSLTLYSGMRINNTIRQANISYLAGVKDLEKSKNDIAIEIARLYLTVMFNQELLETANYQFRTTTQQVERTKKLVDAGALPVTNLLDLHSQSATHEVNVVNAGNDYNLAVLKLKQALLIPADDPFEVIIPEIVINQNELQVKNPASIYEVAELIMPEVKSADLRIEVANLNYKISKGVYAPTLSLNLLVNSNYSSVVRDRETNILDKTKTVSFPIGYVGTEKTNIVNRDAPVVIGTHKGLSANEQFKENINKNINLTLRIPVFNKFKTRSNIQKNILNKQRAEITSKEVRNRLRQSIESAHNAMLAASKSYFANQKQVEALKEFLRITENQYNLGSVHFVDYQVANNNLYMAESNLLRSKYDFVFKQKILDFYLGKQISF